MISDSQHKRNRAKGRDLAVDKILPGDVFVIRNGERRGLVPRLVLNVFVKIINCAQISQMPVKRSFVLSGCFSDARHHYVSTISGVSRYKKMPRNFGVLLSECRRRSR